jgi:hypothetical protein
MSKNENALSCLLLEKQDRGAIKKNKCGNKIQKIHNTIETQIYVVHPVWATPTREISRSFLYYYPSYEGIQPTTNPLQLPLLFLSFSYLRIQYSPSCIAAIHFPHNRGFPSREKNPNIISTVRFTNL